MAPNTESTALSTENVAEEIIHGEKKLGTKKTPNLKWYQFETPIVPEHAIIMGIIQGLFVYWGIMFPYREHPVLVAWGFFMTYVNILGVTAGIHRLWSHRTYKATLPVRIMLASFFYSAGQMKIGQWSRQHRIHHKYSDTDGDPHNAGRGLFFSHIGWLILDEKPEVDECRQKISVDDVLADPVVKVFDGNFWLMQALCIAIIPSFIPWYFWDQDLKYCIISQVCIRYPLAIHITATVNSFAHTFGYRTYDKNIPPAENWFLGLLTIGEGWHNYHHAFPWDYRASEFSNIIFNPTTAFLNILEKLGLVYDLKSVSKEHMQKVIERKGDGNTMCDTWRNIDKSLI